VGGCVGRLQAGAFVDHRLAPIEPLLWPRISVGRQDSLPTFKAKVSLLTRRLRTLPGWTAIDAPRRVVRARVGDPASAPRVVPRDAPDALARRRNG
jgi:hypothetical protein